MLKKKKEIMMMMMMKMPHPRSLLVCRRLACNMAAAAMLWPWPCPVRSSSVVPMSSTNNVLILPSSSSSSFTAAAAGSSKRPLGTFPPCPSLSPCRHFASRSGGRGPSSPRAGDDEDDDDDLDEDEDDEFDDVEDPSGYEWDYDTWNLLHQGKKETEKSRRWPLPMYKAREMVDYHMIKNRVDGLKVITDPKQEYELRKTLHEGLVEFYRKTQAAFDEIDAAVEKEQKNIGGDDKKTLQIEVAGEISETTESQKNSVEEMITEGMEEKKISVEAVESGGRVDSSLQAELPESESQGHPEIDGTLKTGEGQLAEEDNANSEELRTTSVIDDILNDVLTVPDITVQGEDALEAKIKEGAVGDEVNALNYDNWVAYRDQEMAKKYEIKKHHATLRWKIQLVLGPGDVWHPANRKASVAVYVRELGLSKHAKQRLLALVGKRYKSPQDELTIVSERYQHRYENQKDVLRTLLALIEEAKKADEYVNDARINFIREQSKASKGEAGTTNSQVPI